MNYSFFLKIFFFRHTINYKLQTLTHNLLQWEEA